MKAKQLPLDIWLREDADFEHFVVGENQPLLRLLQDLLALEGSSPNLLLWGGAGVGKTHLLQAVCRAAGEARLSCTYVPLNESTLRLAPEMLDGLGGLSLVLLDDVHSVLRKPGWEAALFRLFNEVQDAGTTLLLTADGAPRSLSVALPDLATRLSRCLVMEVQALQGDASLELFRARAEKRGMIVSEEVAGYLMRRAPRDTASLLAMLDQLDRAALAAQRQLTVPFIRETLGW